MSSCSSPAHGGYASSGGGGGSGSGSGAENASAACRLAVRKDLFPEVRLPRLVPVISDAGALGDNLGDISCVKLETDFEQSIDEIASKKLHNANGLEPRPERSKHRKHKQRHRSPVSNTHVPNGCLPARERKSGSAKRPRTTFTPVKGGKNLNLVSSSKSCDDEDTSDDEVLKCSVKLPLITLPRHTGGGKPYSHALSQLSYKKRKESRKVVVPQCSGKPRSMMGICASKTKKKSSSKKLDAPTPAPSATYQSQIMDTNTIKIKIMKASLNIQEFATAVSSVVGKKRSKKKACLSPPSESSGEEYDPAQKETKASVSVAAPKPRNPPSRKKDNSKSKEKVEKVKPASHVKVKHVKESKAEVVDRGPQSPWAERLPIEVLTKIFEHVISMQGTLPAVIRLGNVCRLWHNVSLEPRLWNNVELSAHAKEKMKTDYKLSWLLENRLTKCNILNLGHWKVCNVSWVATRLVECCPHLLEVNLSGWNGLTADQLYELVHGLPLLARLDLSLTSETGGSPSCLSAASMARVTGEIGERLTHLNLANNMFTALPQILTSISTHCINLEVLDISVARATSHPALIPLEALQRGCPKMRVFRAANSQIVLAPPTSNHQDTEGWAQLEELSIAGEASTEVGQYRLDEEALSRLVRGSTRLRLLDLRGLQRLSDSGLVRVPAWDLQHLFLGGCNVIRQKTACLELICEKWSHSLIELDLSWASATQPLDAAVEALAEKGAESKLRSLNLCGSSVSFEPVKKVLLRCPLLESINLASCRALPRGIKRVYTGKELQGLKDSLDPVKVKAKEEAEKLEKEKKRASKRKDKNETISEATSTGDEVKGDKGKPKAGESSASPLADSESNAETVSESASNKEQASKDNLDSPDSKSLGTPLSKDAVTETSVSQSSTPAQDGGLLSPKVNLKDVSPSGQSNPDSSTPKYESQKQTDSCYLSPPPKPDSQVSPHSNSQKGNNSWNLDQFKQTPTHKSEASPLGKPESQPKSKHVQAIEQYSPTPSQEQKLSPESQQNMKQDIKNPNNWNYGNYSPMPRQDNQFPTQPSPYSGQPSPAPQPSPYSAQPSPYSTQPSPYSSQPSPYSAQPSPDTSQIAKPELQKSSSSWNIGAFSPITKQAQYSPHPSTHTSPDPGVGGKNDGRSSAGKTTGQFSPMSRQERIRHSPYSPRPSVETNTGLYSSNRKSPGMSQGNFSSMVRSDCHVPSPETGLTSSRSMPARPHELYQRPVTKPMEASLGVGSAELSNSWGLERYTQGSGSVTNVDNSLSFATPAYTPEVTRSIIESLPSLLNTPTSHSWGGMPTFDTGVRSDEVPDPWTLGQFRVEPPPTIHNTFVEQSVNFDSLPHTGHQGHMSGGFVDDSFTETSRVD